MEKLIGYLGTRVDEETETQFKACAEADGFNDSELLRQLIDAYLHERRAAFARLNSIFGGIEASGNQKREQPGSTPAQQSPAKQPRRNK